MVKIHVSFTLEEELLKRIDAIAKESKMKRSTYVEGVLYRNCFNQLKQLLEEQKHAIQNIGERAARIKKLEDIEAEEKSKLDKLEQGDKKTVDEVIRNFGVNSK